MKKILLILVVLSMLFSLTSCIRAIFQSRFFENFENPELIATVIHSVLFTQGCSWGAEMPRYPLITVLETDEYDRVLFRYTEDATISGCGFSALLILQSFTEEFVYYYEDVNYITAAKEGDLDREGEAIFFDDAIQSLKNDNDWNQPIDLEQCIEKEVITKRYSLPLQYKKMEKICQSEIEASKNTLRGWYTFNCLTQDAYGRFICFGTFSFSGEEQKNIFFAILFQEDLSYTLIELPLFDYQEQFIQFKAENGWNCPPEN